MKKHLIKHSELLESASLLLLVCYMSTCLHNSFKDSFHIVCYMSTCLHNSFKDSFSYQWYNLLMSNLTTDMITVLFLVWRNSDMERCFWFVLQIHFLLKFVYSISYNLYILEKDIKNEPNWDFLFYSEMRITCEIKCNKNKTIQI